MRRISAALVAIGAAAIGTFAVVSTAAAATDPEPIFAEVSAVAQDWTGPYPDVVQSPSPGSSITCETGSVDLVKPDVPDDGTPIYGSSSAGDVGTSVETTNLGLDAGAGGKFVVDVSGDPGQFTNGAVRMFAYNSTNADTLNTAPDFKVLLAPGADQELAVSGVIGTFGLTYDASNDTEGTVSFSGLEFWADGANEGQPVYLCSKPEPEESETTTTTVPATTTTTTKATETTTTSETTTTGATSATTTTSKAAALPVTGASLGGLIAVAFGLVAAGGGTLWFLRRRRANEA